MWYFCAGYSNAFQIPCEPTTHLLWSRCGCSESEMNRMQDLLVVSMELLEQDNVKRVAGMEATQELVSSVAFTVATLLWLSICILFFGADG